MIKAKVLTPELEDFKTGIVDKNSLNSFILALKQYSPVITILHFPTIGFLTIGVGDSFGFVEYMNETKDPPYLLASEGNAKFEVDELVEFDMDGAATPIQLNKCIYLDSVLEIVEYFFNYNKLPNHFQWVEL